LQDLFWIVKMKNKRDCPACKEDYLDNSYIHFKGNMKVISIVEHFDNIDKVWQCQKESCKLKITEKGVINDL